MIILTTILIPAAGALWLALSGRALPERTTYRGALAIAAATLIALTLTLTHGSRLDYPWVPSLGLRLTLHADGLSAPLMLLAASVTLLALWVAAARPPRGGSASTYCASVLAALTGALTAFAARDIILFFVAFETVLIPMWVLITRFGYGQVHEVRRAAMRFVTFTVAGSSLMLVGLIWLVAVTGTSNLDRLNQVAHGPLAPGQGTQLGIAVLLTLGLALKIPVWPAHLWLPGAHTAAPTGGSMILAAVMLKLGTYGLIRLPLASVPEGFAMVAPVLAVAAVIGILWAGLLCLVETDLKRLIAQSSIAHMGFVVLAIAAAGATGSVAGVQAALYGNVAHGVIAALLFAVAGAIIVRWGSGSLDTPHPALREVAPWLGRFVVFAFTASLGLPGLAGFWGELGALAASMKAGQSHALFAWLAALAALGAALAGAYCLRAIHLVWLADRAGQETPDQPIVHLGPWELDRAEVPPLVILVLAVVALGVAPHFLSSTSLHDVTTLMRGGG